MSNIDLSIMQVFVLSCLSNLFGTLAFRACWKRSEIFSMVFHFIPFFRPRKRTFNIVCFLGVMSHTSSLTDFTTNSYQYEVILTALCSRSHLGFVLILLRAKYVLRTDVKCTFAYKKTSHPCFSPLVRFHTTEMAQCHALANYRISDLHGKDSLLMSVLVFFGIWSKIEMEFLIWHTEALEPSQTQLKQFLDTFIDNVANLTYCTFNRICQNRALRLWVKTNERAYIWPSYAFMCCYVSQGVFAVLVQDVLVDTDWYCKQGKKLLQCKHPYRNSSRF